MKRWLLILLFIPALFSCGKDDDPAKGTQDAPLGVTDTSPAYIMNSPDAYPNIAFKCIGPNGIYTTREPSAGAGRPIWVVEYDANCKEGSPFKDGGKP